MNAQYCGIDLSGLQNGSLGVVETTILGTKLAQDVHTFSRRSMFKGKEQAGGGWERSIT